MVVCKASSISSRPSPVNYSCAKKQSPFTRRRPADTFLNQRQRIRLRIQVGQYLQHLEPVKFRSLPLLTLVLVDRDGGQNQADAKQRQQSRHGRAFSAVF